MGEAMAAKNTTRFKTPAADDPALARRNCAHFCAHSTHRSVARRCQSRRVESPQAFEDSRHIATLRKTAVLPLSL